MHLSRRFTLSLAGRVFCRERINLRKQFDELIGEQKEINPKEKSVYYCISMNNL